MSIGTRRPAKSGLSPAWLTGIGVAIVAVAAAALLALGRTPWCRCDRVALWSSDAWGPENSQQLADPYTFTHIGHGILFYALLRWLAPRLSIGMRCLLAVGIESAWEVIENTDAVIEHYRAATMALGYYGDSVINSVGDIAACAVGFGIAARLPARLTGAIFVAMEIALALWIRDGLLINIVMLIHPIEAVKTWQAGVAGGAMWLRGGASGRGRRGPRRRSARARSSPRRRRHRS